MKLKHTRSAFAVIAACTSLFMVSACSGDNKNATESATPAAKAAENADSTSEGYKAGTYDAEGSYANPGGTSTVKVELTIDDAGTISAVTVTPEAKNSPSIGFQTKFAGGISDAIVGKNIDDLHVTNVAGSSLTHSGFEQAVEKIKEEAQA